MKTLVFAFSLFVASLSFASSDIPTYEETFTPLKGCSFWFYSSEARGYVCSSPTTVNVVDSFEFMSLQNEVNNLRARVRRLEAQLSN